MIWLTHSRTSPTLVLSIVALGCYLISAALLAASAHRALKQPARGARVGGLLIGLFGLIAHASDLWFNVLSSTQLALSAAETASLVGWAIALIAVFASWQRAQFSGASAVLLAVAGVLASITQLGTRDFRVASHGWELTAHIVLSTLAYAFATVGAVLAIALALLDRKLRRREPLGWLAALPSVEALESGAFQAIGAGFVMLSLALFSGFVFVENFRSQHLTHKTILSCLAWGIFGTLLFGRWRFGWRGKTALRWILWSFFVLVLAYFGDKFVLETILGRHWG